MEVRYDLRFPQYEVGAGEPDGDESGKRRHGDGGAGDERAGGGGDERTGGGAGLGEEIGSGSDTKLKEIEHVFKLKEIEYILPYVTRRTCCVLVWRQS